MTLDEAIQHCEEKSCGNSGCALEHKQLAEWLTELKKLRKIYSVMIDEKKELEPYLTDGFGMKQLGLTWVQVKAIEKYVKRMIEYSFYPQKQQEWTKEDTERFESCLKRLGTGNPEQPESINSKWFREHVSPQKQQQEDEQPEYSFIETIYRCGKNPRWNIGDTLAYYEFTSDSEGEFVLGKVTNVEFDKEYEDWLYTFEDGSQYDEESLLSDKTYKKN